MALIKPITRAVAAKKKPDHIADLLFIIGYENQFLSFFMSVYSFSISAFISSAASDIFASQRSEAKKAFTSPSPRM